MSFPTIPVLPDIPSRTADTPQQFSNKVDAFLSALPSFRVGVNDSGAWIGARNREVNANANQVASDTAQVAALLSDAQGLANYAGVWSSLSGSYSAGVSVFRNGTFWLLLSDTSAIENIEPGLASSQWRPLVNNLRREVMEKVKRDATVYLDFANGEYRTRSIAGTDYPAFADAVTFTRADPATGVSPIGTIETVGVNEPVFASRDGESLGLQVEPLSTNLWVNSESQQSNPDGASHVSPVNESPIDGVLFNRVEWSNTDIWRGIWEQSVLPEGVATISVFVGDNSTLPYILFNGLGGVDWRVNVEVETGEVLNTLGIPEILSAKSQRVKGGYRVSVTVNASGATQARWRPTPSAGIGFNQPYDAGSIFEYTGVQVESGYLTSYIKTEASQVTRGGVSAISDSLPRLLERQGTIYAEFTRSLLNSLSAAVGFGNAGNEQLTILTTGGNNFRFEVRCGNDGEFFIIDAQAPPAGGNIKTVVTYERQPSGDYLYRWYVNGRFVGENTLPRLPNGFFTTPIGIGQRRGNSNTLLHNGTIASVKTATILLSQAEAIALTTLEDE